MRSAMPIKSAGSRYDDASSFQNPCGRNRPSSGSVSSTSSSVFSACSTDSRRNSISSNATTISRVAERAYWLVCDVCYVEFEPERMEYWLGHSRSHFDGIGFPPKVICIFCPQEFESEGDNVANWQKRMVHIQGHFQALQGREDMREDYWVLDYLGKHQSMNEEDYLNAIQTSERPSGSTVVSRGYKADAVLRKEELSARSVVDTATEDRLERRRRKKG